MIKSYGKIYNLGSKELLGTQGLFVGDVQVEEKVDGSQFSFGLHDNVIMCKSKSENLDLNNPEKMFTKAVETVKSLLLVPEWTYRGEYLRNPKHNALCYDRVPEKNIILFDVTKPDGVCLTYEEKVAEASRLGLECVPLIWRGDGAALNVEILKSLLDRTSILGGAKIEGLVIKNYKNLTKDGYVLMGKHVSEGFKEVHGSAKQKSGEGSKNILVRLIEEYKVPARWQKAVLHSEEEGKISFELKDIPILIKAVQKDIEEECEAEIKDKLWLWARSHIMKGSVGGLAEWWKEKLLERQVEMTLTPSDSQVTLENKVEGENK